MDRDSLRREQRLVRAALAVLILVTVVINFMAAGDNRYAQLIDPWPPLMYFLLVESLARVPGRATKVNVARWIVTGVVALTAGWISIQHVAEFAALAGWSPLKQLGLSLLLDGGIIALSLALIVIAGEINDLAKKPKPRPKRTPKPDSARAQSPAILAAVIEPQPSGLEHIRKLMAEGKTQPEIADALGISERTVRRRLTGAA